jgi:hypothetical protein
MRTSAPALGPGKMTALQRAMMQSGNKSGRALPPALVPMPEEGAPAEDAPGALHRTGSNASRTSSTAELAGAVVQLASQAEQMLRDINTIASENSTAARHVSARLRAAGVARGRRCRGGRARACPHAPALRP